MILSNFESLTTDICETDENGNLTLLRDGTCDLRAMVSAAGYTDVIVSGSLEVALAQMNLSWDGYDDSDDTISYGDAAPALESPSLTTATPHRFSYTSGDTTVCTVDEEGALTIIRDGECVITLTASALGYNEATVTSTLTINPATMRGIMWETVYASTPSLGVGSSMITFPPLGVPEGASVVYRTESAACTVDQISGTITGQSEGDCSVTMTVSLLGYEDFTETQTVPIGRGQEDVAWSGYSARTMVFGEAPPTLIPPTGIGGGGGASYGAFTFDTCRINFRTGLLRILNHGLCRAALFVYQEGYGVKTFFFDLTITPGVMGDFSWAGYDSNSVEFPNVPALEEPTGAPKRWRL